ncbi:MAG: hypothetical protein ACYDAR_12725, partial [Thermomicrobiales bacterium]
MTPDSSTPAIMVMQSFVFMIEILFIFSVIGYGATTLILPGMDGYELLLVPAVGWVIASVALLWLSVRFTTATSLVVVIGIFGGVSLFRVLRDRNQLLERIKRQRFALLFSILIGVIAYLYFLLFAFHARVFGFDGIGPDGIYLYGPVTEYLRTHTFSVLTTTSVLGQYPGNLSLQSLQAVSITFPSLGQLDSAVSVLTGWSSYRVLEPLDSSAIMLSLPAWYVFFSYSVALPRRVTIVAIVLMIANPLTYWVMSMDFVMQLHVAMLLPCALCVMIHTLKTSRIAPAIFMGLVSAALLATYPPIFVILAICAVGYASVTLVQSFGQRRWRTTIRQLFLMAVSGIIAFLPVLPAIIRGRAVWLSTLESHVAGWGISTFFPLSYMLGVSPLPDSPQFNFGKSTLWWRHEWWPFTDVLAGIVVLAIIL